jgi:hypothetical protein
LFEEVGDRRRQQCWKELHPASNGIQMLPSSSRPDYYVPKVFGSFIVDVEIGTKIVSWMKKSKFSDRNISHAPPICQIPNR